MPSRDAASQCSPQPRAADEKLAADLRRIDSIARSMDAALLIPGTNIRFGWDALVGLIPGVGDALTAAPLIYFLWVGLRHRISALSLVMMVWRQLIDVVLGAIPLLGDVFDVAYRANLRNAQHLRKELERRSVEGTAGKDD